MVKHFFTFLVFLCIGTFSFASTHVIDSVKIDGVMRHFKMVLPKELKTNAPLVFVLHGYGGGNLNDGTWMDSAAHKYNFALCVPQGIPDPQGQRSWNVGYPFQKGWKVNDVKTLRNIAKYVQKKYKLSKKNTFLTGMSNGGEMCYLVAYSGDETFKAVAPIAGLTLKWMYHSLNAPKGMPLMEVHGTEDRISEWEGDLNNIGGWGSYIPVETAVNYWVAVNRCTHVKKQTIKGLNPSNGRHIIKYEFTGSKQGNDVWLYKVVGGEHSTHTDDLNTGDEVWKFFSKYLEEE